VKRQPFCNFLLAGVSLTDFGLMIPSPFTSLELSNSEVSSMTSWTLSCVVGGDSSKKINASAFEALLYTSAQAADKYPNSSGIPVSMMFGWLDERGNVAEYVSYQGFALKYSFSTSGLFTNYKVTGFASRSVQSSLPVLRIPEISGFVQPSAVAEGLAKAVKATNYYQLDIDHNDAPTYIHHGAMTTSFNQYVRGSAYQTDDYDDFPGLLRLSKSYSASREAAGLKPGYRKLSSILNNASYTPVNGFLVKSNTDTRPQCLNFSYWVDEPTMTKPGVIHYKSNAALQTSKSLGILQYGTTNTNILSINGSYDGIAYNMSNMNFQQVGFAVDASGNSIAQMDQVVNSWSSSLANVFQAANIINDINALATQFSGNFTIQIAGTVNQYTIAQPVSLLIMHGNTLSPVSGIYSVMSVSHTISNQFITTLKIQRLVMSSANSVASAQNIYVSGSKNYGTTSFTKTKNILTPYSVDFGIMFPTYEHMSA
jgi:hypothetical protein